MATADKKRRSCVLAAVVGILGLLFMAGCDQALPGDESLTLPEKEVTFRFEFGAETTGEVLSNGSADLGPEILEDGFQRDEVLSAEVSSVELERILPNQTDLSGFLETVALMLPAEGEGTFPVASLADPPAARTGQMSLESPDVTALVKQEGGFQAVLEPALTDEATGDYVLRATLVIRVTVEGVE